MNTNLPPVGYSPREFEIIANLSGKYSYNLMAANKLDFFYDVAGNIKISPRETYRFLREKEGGRQVVASKWICVTKNTNKKIYMNERMLNVKQVRDALGLSYQQVIRLMRSGDLRAYHYVGGVPVTKEEVTEDTYGLGVRASDVNEMREQFLVK